MLQHFLKRTIIKGKCRIWQGAVNTDGYARALINGNENGKVHREIFYLVNGYYPPVVRHSCDNPLCIEPTHLQPGTQLDNVKDRHTRKRTYGYVSQKERTQVLELRHQGLTMETIANTLQIKTKRVEYILHNWSKDR